MFNARATVFCYGASSRSWCSDIWAEYIIYLVEIIFIAKWGHNTSHLSEKIDTRGICLPIDQPEPLNLNNISEILQLKL